MRLLHQYILKQFLFYLILSILLFSGVLVIGKMMKGMMGFISEGKFSLGDCAFLMITLLPSMISYALPFGFVTATLLTGGTISSNNEWVALKSSGINPLTSFSSILLLTTCSVGLSLMVNFHYAPNAISSVKHKVQRIIQEEPLRFITPKRFIYDFPGYIIFVRDLNDEQLHNFHIWELDDHGKITSHIYAKQGTLKYNIKKEMLTLTLLQGNAERIFAKEKDTPLISFKKFSLNLSLNHIFKSLQIRKKIQHMTLSEMLALRNKSIHEGDLKKQTKIQTHIQMQCAMAFSTLALIIAILPLAIKFRRNGIISNIVIASAICIVYYFLMIILSFLFEWPHLRPDLIIWLPNIILQLWGIRQLLIINQH